LNSWFVEWVIGIKRKFTNKFYHTLDQVS